MKTSRNFLTLILYVNCIFVCNLHAQIVDIPVVLQNRSKISCNNYPVTLGVPFPRGKLKTIDTLAVCDDSGNVLPSQKAISAFWPQDKSISWVMFDFSATLSGTEKQNFRIKSVVSTDTSGIICETLPKRLTIDTGAAIFGVNRENFNLLESVKINNKELIVKKEIGGPFLRDVSGTLFAAGFGKADNVHFEESGPQRAVVKAEGFYYSVTGKKLCRYRVRMHFYNQQKFVRTFYTFIVTVDSKEAEFRDIGMALPVKAQNGSFGSEQSKSYNSDAYLLQYDWDKYLVADSAVPRAWDITGDGKQSSGSLIATCPEGQVIMQVNDFAATYPNELEFRSGQALIYHLWPKHGVKKPNRVLDAGMYKDLWYVHEGKTLQFTMPEKYIEQPFLEKLNIWTRKNIVEHEPQSSPLGLAITAEIHMGFGLKPSRQAELCALWETPISIMATPDWMCASGAFGKISSYDPVRFPRIEGGISRIFDWERRMQDKFRDYGKFNYGDSHTAWDVQNKSWSLHRCWRGYHHSSGLVPWLLYVRSGDRKYYDWAIANSRHLMNLDICHWSNSERSNMQYPAQKLKGGLCDYKGLSHWNSGGRLFDYNIMTNFMLYYYYLTGDRQGLDTAQLWADSAVARTTQGYSSRTGAGVAGAMLDMYQATGKREYYNCAMLNIEAMFETQNVGGDKKFVQDYTGYPRPKGSFDQWQGYSQWLEKYIALTESQEGTKRLILWADAYLDGCGDVSSRFGCGLELNILSYAYFLTGKTKYLRRALWLSDRFIDGSIVNKPGDPMDGCVLGGISMASYFMTRAPILMAALKQHRSKVDPDFPEKGYMRYPQDRKKLDSEIYFLNQEVRRFTIVIDGFIGKMPEYELYNPQGKLIITKKLDLPAQKYKKITIEVENPILGQYCLKISNIGILNIETTPNLPTVFKIKELYQTLGGTRLYFRVPKDSLSLKVSTNRYNASPSFITSLELLGPDGERRGIVKNGDAIFSIPTEDTDKIWSLRGRFGASSSLSISGSEGQKIEYLAPSPEKWFKVKK